MLINLGLAIGLMPWLGYLAAPVATTSAAWAMLGLLMLGARRFGTSGQMDARLRRRVPRQILAAMVMGAVIFGLGWVLAPWLASGTGLRFAALGLVVLVGAISYGGVLFAIGGLARGDFGRLTKR